MKYSITNKRNSSIILINIISILLNNYSSDDKIIWQIKKMIHTLSVNFYSMISNHHLSALLWVN
jgi:hypothetical protein